MRIVSLLPSATEICFSLELGDDVVGVTHECDYPPEAQTRPHLTRSNLPEALQTHPGTTPAPMPRRSAEIDRHVRADVHAGSSLYALNGDLLEQLAPDLIITQELCAVCAVSYDIVAGAAKRLRGDPRIISLEPSTLDDVFGTIQTVADIAGAQREAASLLERLRSSVAMLREQTRALPKLRTLLLEWTDPPMSAGHWVPELVALAGGEAVLASPRANSQTLTWDAIASADPDVILIAPCGYDLATARAATRELQDAPPWKNLRAVQSGDVWVIDGSAYVNRPGPRLVDTAQIFAHALHADACTLGELPENALARA